MWRSGPSTAARSERGLCRRVHAFRVPDVAGRGLRRHQVIASVVQATGDALLAPLASARTTARWDSGERRAEEARGLTLD